MVMERAQILPSKKKRRLSSSSPRSTPSHDNLSPHTKGSLESFIVRTKSPVSSTELVDQRRAALDSNSAVKTSLSSRIEQSLRLEKCTASSQKLLEKSDETPDAQEVDSQEHKLSKKTDSQNEHEKQQFADEFLSICFSGISPSKKPEHEAAATKNFVSAREHLRSLKRMELSDEAPAKPNEKRPEIPKQTPEPVRIQAEVADTPQNQDKKLTPNGFLAENQYVSPGDSFWDEAIRLLGSRPDLNPAELKLNASNPSLHSPLPVRCFDFAKDCLEQEPKIEAAAAALDQKQEPRVETAAATLDQKQEPRIETSAATLNQKQEPRIETAAAPLDHQLSSWLPPEVCGAYSRKGLKSLYQWQVDCLSLEWVLEGKSLVYCASTSAGKSLVAEVLMLRRILATGKRAMLVLPYVALCSEKTEHLESVLEPVNKRVRGFFGTQGGGALPSDTSVAVCTIEKANSLINKLIEESRLSELAVVVIDELHMVGDRDRGYLLELMLTKLRYASGKGENMSCSQDGDGSGLQIVGMSATMPNVGAVASWLQAAFYQTDFRPVPLDEFIKVGNVIYNLKLETVRTLRPGADLGGKDPDHVVQLCHEVVSEGHSTLIFCSSRNACETTARHVAKFLPKFSVSSRAGAGYKDGSEAVEDLRRCPAGLDPVLAETMPAGVAYHHAGLTAEERDVVESCFRQGIVRVLTATSTLAAGVNLPARRVIFRQPKVGSEFLDGIRYRQMAGRAGRAGIDTHGESILICKGEELNRMLPILKEGCRPLHSCLTEDKNGMMRALLEVVAGGIVQTAQDVNRYVRCTLLNSTQPFDDVVKSAQDSLRWLCHKRLIEWDSELQMYKITPLGKAAFGSSMSPEESLVVFEDLAKARESFVLASELHLVYEVTPIHVELEPDWGVYYKRFIELSAVEQAVGNRVGVMEASLMRMAHGAPMQGRKRSTRSPRSEKTSELDQVLRVYRRFYVALILFKLVQEVPLMEVCSSFKVPRGTVQALQDMSGRFAAMISTFCERLGWHDLEGLISKFQNRVSFGVRAEIVGLTEIPFVKAARARALYKAGLRTVEAVAEASIPELINALIESTVKGSADNRQRWVHSAAAKKIKNGARRIVLDRAEESRKAAFSAFQALGVAIPESLAQPLPETIQAIDPEDPETRSTEQDEAPEKTDPDLKESKRVKLSDADAFRGTMAMAPAREEEPRREQVDKGPLDVDKLQGGFESFSRAWDEAQEFFFDVHFEEELGSPSEILGFAVCWEDSPVYYVRVSSGEVWSRIRSIFEKKNAIKVCWDLKKQLRALGNPGAGTLETSFFQRERKVSPLEAVSLESPVVDLSVLGWILWPDEENTSLEQLVKIRVPGEIAAAASRSGRWTNQMGKVAHNGCCRRAAQARALHSVLWKLAVSEALHDPLMQLEMPLVKVLSDMEAWPIGVNMKSCRAARRLLEARIKQLESNAQILAGMNFSLSLPADVADLLYRHLKLPVPPGCAKGKQHPSTDKQALDQLRDRHPVVSLIKEHRSLSKLLHTTIGAVMSCARKPGNAKSRHLEAEDIYLIYGHWLQTSTGTGRLSMEDPNLQCVEHAISFLLEEASVTRQIEVNPRQFFVPTQEGWVIISADYSQVELRLMAHFSGDESLVELLRNPTGDVFRLMTAKWTGQGEAEVSDRQRERTKRLVYGLLYGMGINSLADNMECSVGEASRCHEQFKAAFPGVNSWLQSAVSACRQNGYVKTLAGRKRYLEKINNSRRVDQAKAERQAVNSICQGSAADLIKLAMINLHAALTGKSTKTFLHTDSQGNSRAVNLTSLLGRCRLLLQIHDELVLEVDKSILVEAASVIRSCMEGAASLTVPLNVKLQTGPSWGQLTTLAKQ